MGTNVKEGLVPQASDTLVTKWSSVAGKGLVLSNVNQLATQAEEIPSHLHSSATASNPSNTPHSHRRSSTTSTFKTLLSIDEKEDDLELSYRGKESFEVFSNKVRFTKKPSMTTQSGIDDMRSYRRSAEFQVNTYTTDSQRSPSVVGLSDGGFVVTWTSSGSRDPFYGIYATRIPILTILLHPYHHKTSI